MPVELLKIVRRQSLADAVGHSKKCRERLALAGREIGLIHCIRPAGDGGHPHFPHLVS